MDGQFETTDAGNILVIRRRYPLVERYGRTNLEKSLALPVHLLDRIYPGLLDFRMRETLFFDTETTGLAGGSGTYAFLVGLGFFEGDHLVTEQLLMRDHSDEGALLALLSDRLKRTSHLVSFNGRTFDAQLLSTRYQMHRLEAPFGDRAHFDLLHISRRLWRWSNLPDCRLETLETRVLGAPRHQDVPGWMIPNLFFDFLRDRDPGPLRGVVEHNRRDIVAMVALCSYMSDLFLPEAPPDDPHLCLGLARFWAAIEETERSDTYYRRALTDRRLREEAREKGQLLWARQLKKRRETDKAAMLWRRVLAHYPGNLEAAVELAKWLEHGHRDFRNALHLVENSLRTRGLTSVVRRQLEYRADRLRRRLEGAR